MSFYIHQLEAWPAFWWDEHRLIGRLGAVRHQQGRLFGRMEALGFDSRSEAALATLTEDVVTSSAIEGESLDKDQVRSSIARRMGLEVGGAHREDRHVDGVVEMTLDATQNFAAPLTAARLFGWHAALFPTGHSGMTKITVGGWRTREADPMQVVSGAYGRQKVHFEAPAGDRVADEMARFLAWFNGQAALDPVLKAAVAHLWFVTIHPFEDGNGRIARTIADMALARSEGSSQRFYSLSSQIRVERKAYYDTLEASQKGDLDITPWLTWFLDCLQRALDGAETLLGAVLDKAAFWKGVAGQPLNARQRQMLNRLLDGFEGKLTSSKWAALTKTSPDTALRDISNLVARGLLVREAGGGRSTSYALGRAVSDASSSPVRM